mmetsp:Transcript_11611/g.37244  ORF Transcript_11611/g.37244 Transcript_11611/m.37244 type:complete len:278 (+) Transcript_11611:113-946(+)
MRSSGREPADPKLFETSTKRVARRESLHEIDVLNVAAIVFEVVKDGVRQLCSALHDVELEHLVLVVLGGKAGLADADGDHTVRAFIVVVRESAAALAWRHPEEVAEERVAREPLAGCAMAAVDDGVRVLWHLWVTHDVHVEHERHLDVVLHHEIGHRVGVVEGVVAAAVPLGDRLAPPRAGDSDVVLVHRNARLWEHLQHLGRACDEVPDAFGDSAVVAHGAAVDDGAGAGHPGVHLDIVRHPALEHGLVPARNPGDALDLGAEVCEGLALAQTGEL